MENTKLEFRENALKAVAQKAISLKTGARGLRSIIENILMGSKRVIFFGLLWAEICSEIAELRHMEEIKIGASNVLLLRSVEEFLKTPLQKREVMKILNGWR